MTYAEVFNSSFWWIFPLVMIAVCFFMMRGRKGSLMCGFGPRDEEGDSLRDMNSAMDVLDRRYAGGEIGKEEYQEIRRDLNRQG